MFSSDVFPRCFAKIMQNSWAHVMGPAMENSPASHASSLQSFHYQVRVHLKAGVHDAPGEAVQRSLAGLGLPQIRDVRIGRVVNLTIEASSAEQGRAWAQQAAETLLANLVIERFEITEINKVTEVPA